MIVILLAKKNKDIVCLLEDDTLKIIALTDIWYQDTLLINKLSEFAYLLFCETHLCTITSDE